VQAPCRTARLLNVVNVGNVNVVNVDQVNDALSRGDLDRPGLFPRLETLRDAPAVFHMKFGLDRLPAEPGVILIRGARQSGKSTWLEGVLRETIEAHGAASAFFLDGDHLRDADHLADEILRLAHAFRRDSTVRRLFIDEITAVPDWARGLKRVLDRGELHNVLVVTTGSHASDLRHGRERLPGRKGQLARTGYLFLPVSFREFLRVGASLGERALPSYLISGGSPLACGEIIRTGRLSECVVETVRDWVQGECARAGRPRRSLVTIMQQLHRHGGTPLGQTKLAREAGLANNSVAAGWIEFLADLLCIGISPAWDSARAAELARKPAKFPFVNLLVASAWALESPRSAEEFVAMTPARQGVWYEWAVAQELFRRSALRGEAEPERLPFWQSKEHEIDFVMRDGSMVEVKRGRASGLEFAWFGKTFPRKKLQVVCTTPFETDRVRGVTLHQFLLGETS
jgi:predicted AAA+ superfamily ATPase